MVRSSEEKMVLVTSCIISKVWSSIKLKKKLIVMDAKLTSIFIFNTTLTKQFRHSPYSYQQKTMFWTVSMDYWILNRWRNGIPSNWMVVLFMGMWMNNIIILSINWTFLQSKIVVSSLLPSWDYSKSTLNHVGSIVPSKIYQPRIM